MKIAQKITSFFLSVAVIFPQHVRYLEPLVDRSHERLLLQSPSVSPHQASTDRNTKSGKSFPVTQLPCLECGRFQ